MLGGTNDSICEETKQPEPTKCNIMIPFKYIPTKKKGRKKKQTFVTYYKFICHFNKSCISEEILHKKAFGYV